MEEFPLHGLARGKQRLELTNPLGPKVRFVSFPSLTKARRKVLPYLNKMDPREEEVDGDVVAEEPKLGYYDSLDLPLRLFTRISHYWALEWDTPSSPQGVRRLTEARWARLHHNRLPVIFGQSEATSVFAL